MKLASSIAFLFPACCSFAQLTDKLDLLFKQQRSDLPGIALQIEQKGKIIYQKTVGLSNEKLGEHIDESSNFRMASLSKQFTAMGVLLLAKERRLSLEDPIQQYLPELPADIGKKILIRQLLTHSSGLLDYEQLIAPGQTTQVLDSDVLRLLQEKDSTYFEPGTQFRYSNTGFCLLSLIIERVAHQSFASFIEKNLFVPLQMEGSRVFEPGVPITHRAMGYAKDDSGHLFFSDQSVTSATKGDGGIYTSLKDYLKWIHAIEHNKFLDLGLSIRKIRVPVNMANKSYYGAGWFDLDTEPEVFFHSGSTCGFTNFVILLPKEEWSLIYFSNIANNDGLFKAILKIVEEASKKDFTKVLALYELTR
jgi:CubicO group peptidase (beta-lactamase class C family)